MTVLLTARLCLRALDEDDAGFVLEMLNQPDFLRFIGDRGVRDLEQSRAYLRNGPIAGYTRHGFGMSLVELRESGASIGLCGLVVREDLPAPDLGFAFLPAYHGRGLAFEAAAATLAHARGTLGLERILAIVSPDNVRSQALLHRLGMREAGTLRLAGEDKDLVLMESAAADPAPTPTGDAAPH
jgi:RimJ/RimL family protein N-acetyltransferase